MSGLAALSKSIDGELLSVTYNTKWDAGLVTGCACSAAFFGPFSGGYEEYRGYDCSQKSCPTGDDPRTFNQTHEQQTLVCTATSGQRELATPTCTRARRGRKT